MKVTIENRSVRTIPAKDMKVGQVGIFKTLMGCYNEQIVVRMYNGYVLLSDPEKTWSGFSNNIIVELLPVGTKIILEVTE